MPSSFYQLLQQLQRIPEIYANQSFFNEINSIEADFFQGVLSESEAISALTKGIRGIEGMLAKSVVVPSSQNSASNTQKLINANHLVLNNKLFSDTAINNIKNRFNYFPEDDRTFTFHNFNKNGSYVPAGLFNEDYLVIALPPRNLKGQVIPNKAPELYVLYQNLTTERDQKQNKQRFLVQKLSDGYWEIAQISYKKKGYPSPRNGSRIEGEKGGIIHFTSVTKAFTPSVKEQMLTPLEVESEFLHNKKLLPESWITELNTFFSEPSKQNAPNTVIYRLKDQKFIKISDLSEIDHSSVISVDGRLFNFYHKLGKGANGHVYLVQDLNSAEWFILKISTPNEINQECEYGTFEKGFQQTICVSNGKAQCDYALAIKPYYFSYPLREVKNPGALFSPHELAAQMHSLSQNVYEFTCGEAPNSYRINPDIKPGNVLLDLIHHTARLIDRGDTIKIDGKTSSSCSTSHNALGTIGYQSPEQLHAITQQDPVNWTLKPPNYFLPVPHTEKTVVYQLALTMTDFLMGNPDDNKDDDLIKLIFPLCSTITPYKNITPEKVKECLYSFITTTLRHPETPLKTRQEIMRILASRSHIKTIRDTDFSKMFATCGNKVKTFLLGALKIDPKERPTLLEYKQFWEEISHQLNYKRDRFEQVAFIQESDFLNAEKPLEKFENIFTQYDQIWLVGTPLSASDPTLEKKRLELRRTLAEKNMCFSGYLEVPKAKSKNSSLIQDYAQHLTNHIEQKNPDKILHFSEIVFERHPPSKNNKPFENSQEDQKIKTIYAMNAEGYLGTINQIQKQLQHSMRTQRLTEHQAHLLFKGLYQEMARLQAQQTEHKKDFIKLKYGRYQQRIDAIQKEITNLSNPEQLNELTLLKAKDIITRVQQQMTHINYTSRFASLFKPSFKPQGVEKLAEPLKEIETRQQEIITSHKAAFGR